MIQPYVILLTGAVLLQSLLVGIAGTGPICLGGGHEHPKEDTSTSCELDCDHASKQVRLLVPVGENHADCSCVDIDLSISELLSSVSRTDKTFNPALIPKSPERPLIAQIDWQPKRYLPPVPSWFEPGGTQRVSHLSTTRLNV